MKFTVILEPDSRGGYSVICPAIPGCVSEGELLDAVHEFVTLLQY